MPYCGHIQVKCHVENSSTRLSENSLPLIIVSLSNWSTMVVNEGNHIMCPDDECVSHWKLNFDHFSGNYFHFLDGAHCSPCIFTVIRAQNIWYLYICGSKAQIVPTRLPKYQICNTYFHTIKMLGRNRARWDDSNAYKIIIFGQFVVELWTLEVSHRKVHILINFARWRTLMQTAII